MKKVLIIGPNFFQINQSVEWGFKKLGFQTKVIDFEEVYPVNIVTKFTCGFLRKIGFDYFVRKYDTKINNLIVQIFYEYKPDIVLVIKGHKLNIETLEVLKRSKLVLWMMDSISRVPETLKNINIYDLIYVFDENDVNYLKELGISSEILPLALDERLYFPLNDVDIKYDVVFIGSLYDYRINLMKQLIEKFPERRIVSFGPFPSFFNLLKNHKLLFGRYSKNFIIGTIEPKKANKIFSESNIVLNLHADNNLNACNLRFFEIAGTDKIQIVNRKYFVESEFQMESLMFNNPENIFRIMEDIFYNAKFYEHLSQDIYKNVIDNHTYYNRALSISKRITNE